VCDVSLFKLGICNSSGVRRETFGNRFGIIYSSALENTNIFFICTVKKNTLILFLKINNWL